MLHHGFLFMMHTAAHTAKITLKLPCFVHPSPFAQRLKSGIKVFASAKAYCNMTEKCFSKGSVCPPSRQPGVLRLYNMRFCPFAKRVCLILAAKKIPYEAININLDDKPEWYLNMYPEGKVPVLEGDGVFLSESLVICDYLDVAYPGEKLNPADAYERAREKMFLDTKFPKVTAVMMKLYKTPEKAKETFETAQEVFAEIEKELETKSSTFFGGSKPTMLDLMMIPWFETFMIIDRLVGEDFLAALFISKEKFPRLNQWLDEMLKLSPVKERHNPKGMSLFLSSVKNGKRDFDAGL